MKLNTTLKKTSNNYYYIPIPLEFGEKLITQYGKRIICQYNGRKIHSAIQKSQQLGYFIMVGKATLKKLEINDPEQLELLFSKDESTYQMDICEEMATILEQDIEGKEKFESLTKGKQRSLLHYINKAKRTETRIDRGLRIMENLKVGFTDLQELLRQ